MPKNKIHGFALLIDKKTPSMQLMYKTSLFISQKTKICCVFRIYRKYKNSEALMYLSVCEALYTFSRTIDIKFVGLQMYEKLFSEPSSEPKSIMQFKRIKSKKYGLMLYFQTPQNVLETAIFNKTVRAFEKHFELVVNRTFIF